MNEEEYQEYQDRINEQREQTINYCIWNNKHLILTPKGKTPKDTRQQ
jgi:hypothetical protein